RRTTMVRRKVYTQQMLTRVFDFGTKHAEIFPKDSIAGEVLAGIGQAVTALSGHSSEQISGNGSVRTTSTSRAAARKALEVQLARIDQTARVLKIDRFYVPQNRADSALINTGRAFARDAEPLKQDVVKQGIPAGFIEDLKAA